MTRPPEIQLERSAAAARRGSRLLPPARYRHPGDIIRLVTAGFVLIGALTVTAATQGMHAGASALVVTAVAPSMLPGRVLAGLVQAVFIAAAGAAEAFAATRGVASPTQLRAFMKRDPRDLLGEFRALGPQRPPIVLQRWSIRRVALAAAMLAIITAAVYQTGDAFFPAARNLGAYPPSCGTGHSMILSAQAVPSAALLPCIAALPSGWSIGGAEIASGKTRLWLDSDRAGPRAVTVTLTATCDTSGARQIPSDQPGTSRFERPLSLVPVFSGLRFYTFPGGCVTYEFHFRPGASPVLAVAVDSALAFQSRSSLVHHVWHTENLVLCGRGAACPG